MGSLRQTRFESTLVANRFEELSRLRAERRATWEATQAQQPVEFVGVCPDMCPEYERHEREAHFDVSPFEVLGPSRPAQLGEPQRIDHRRAVKKYHRPAAGNEAPLPEDVRPPAILRITMDYLLNVILDKVEATFSDKHKFVRDRTRSIRQDIIVQQRAIQKDPDALLTVVRLHEEIARFHILSGHRLCGKDFAEFDPFQNTEQLRKVLQSLQEYYTDIRKVLSVGGNAVSSVGRNNVVLPVGGNAVLLEALRNEAEFRSYQLLTHAEDQDVFRQALLFPAEVFSSPLVQFALRCVSAYHQVDYVRYFKMVQSAEYLQACLLHTHSTKLRRTSLRIISQAYSSKEALPAGRVASWLLVEDLSELKPLLGEVGGEIFNDITNGTLMIRFGLSGDSDEQPTTNVTERRIEAIEGKVAGVPVSTIIRALPSSIQPTMSIKRTLSIIPDEVKQPPPTLPPISYPKLEQIKSTITSLMINNLIDWVAQSELDKIAEKSLGQEKERRRLLKQGIIERVLQSTFDSILHTICLDLCTTAVNYERNRIVGTRQKAAFIIEYTEKLIHELLSEVIKKECYSIAIGAKPLTRIDDEDDGFATPISRKRVRTMSSSIMSPFKFTTLPAPSCMMMIEEVVLKNNDSISARITQLQQSTSQERLESLKWEELLRKAINS